MSMSTFVEGFYPPDKKWKAMKEVWDACNAADTKVPDEVNDFFDGEEPDDAGVCIDLEGHKATTVYQTESGSGFEIDLSLLPKNITTIRCYNSW